MRNRLAPQPVLKPGEVEIEGLYMPDRIYVDLTPDQARRAFHDEHPGIPGTILAVRTPYQDARSAKP